MRRKGNLPGGPWQLQLLAAYGQMQRCFRTMRPKMGVRARRKFSALGV